MLHNNQEWIFSTENILQTQTSKRIHQVSICLKFSPNKGDFFSSMYVCIVQIHCEIVPFDKIWQELNMYSNCNPSEVSFILAQSFILKDFFRKVILINVSTGVYSTCLFFSNYKCFQKCATLCFQKSVTFVSIQKYKSNDRMTKN